MRRLARVLAIGAIGAVPLVAAAQQRPTFRSTANGVLVNAFVLLSGRPVDRLTSADFIVTDNGEKETVNVSPADGPIDLTLVIDAGGDAARYATAFRQTVRGFAAVLRPTDRIRLLACAGVVREVVPMQPVGRSGDLGAIGGADAPYGAAIVHGLFDAMVREADPDRRQVVVVLATFTGRDIFGPEALVSIASSSDATVYIAVEPTGTPIFGATFRALGRVVATTGGLLLLKRDSSGFPPSFGFSARVPGASGGAVVASFKGLKDVTSAVLSDLHHGYVLSYSPPGGTAPGWHDLTVRVILPQALVRARKRYFAARE